MEFEWNVAGIAIFLWAIMMGLFIVPIGFGDTWLQVLGWPRMIGIGSISLVGSYFIIYYMDNK